MSLKQTVSILFTISIFTSFQTFGQSKFKAGLGLNVISNNQDMQYLDTYFAKSLHASYTFFRKSNFSIAAEMGNSLKANESDGVRKLGFISSLPISFQYDFRKVLIYAGAGPAFLWYRENYYQYEESHAGFYINPVVGVGFKGKTILGDYLYPEYNIRLSYFRHMNNTADAGMISFIFFLRGS